MKDPYTVLGIDPTSDAAEVKRAFRALAMQYHPVSPLACSQPLLHVPWQGWW